MSILRSAARDAGVHQITVECDCGNVFVNHTDSDFVICPNCKSKGRWRDSGMPAPTGFESALLLRPMEISDEEQNASAEVDSSAILRGETGAVQEREEVGSAARHSRRGEADG